MIGRSVGSDEPAHDSVLMGETMGLLDQAAESENRTSDSVWQLWLLGAWQLRGRDNVVEVSSNAQRLLALLALRGVSARSYMAGLLWPDCSDLHAQGNLRATLSRLQRRNFTDLLRVSSRTLGLHDAVEVDVHHLRGNGVGGDQPDPAQTRLGGLARAECRRPARGLVRRVGSDRP